MIFEIDDFHETDPAHTTKCGPVLRRKMLDTFNIM